MSLSKNMIHIATFVVVAIFGQKADAAYIWSNVIPANGSQGSATLQNVGAILNWSSGDSPVNNASFYVTVLNQSGVTVTYNSKNITISGSQVTFSGAVSFSPALNSGTKYMIEFRGMTSSMNTVAESTTVTVP